jgi:formylglycine-generating enzyme required for sulfatase activity
MHRFLSYIFFVIICCVLVLSSCKKDDKGTPSNPTTNPVNIETALIPAGTFTMGSPASEPGRYIEELLHQVTLSTFRMSKYEITNAQYAVFLNAKGIGSNGLYSSGAYPNKVLIYVNTISGLIWTGTQWQPVVGKEIFPVVDVTWYGAAEFAIYAGGRLPTEAEWEYACRSNSTTPFNTGNCLSNTQANYKWVYPLTSCTNKNTSFPAQTQAVNSYSPNTWELHDMHGNVGEWCSDWFGSYLTTVQTNPTGLNNGVDRVVRGGGWSSNASTCRSAFRGRTGPSDNNIGIGFRLAFAP